MITIKLPSGTYDYDPAKPLGKPGGFGQVFLGCTSSGMEVAVKRLHLSAASAAHRELSIADELKGRTLAHVVPFIDAGEDAESGDYFVVMPKAEMNLSSHIAHVGKLDATAAAACMMQVVSGLIEVGDLVHRDLKPDNILFHDGKWKIADFGIARFVSEVTAANTLKDCLSPAYAAPEQWRLERATHATDVYALGCIGFFLLSANAPYHSNHSHEHQFSQLPAFACADSRLSSLITIMTRKSPQVRPSLQRVGQVLQTIKDNPPPAASGGGGMLAQAAAFAVQREEAIEAQKSLAQAKEEARNQLARDAFDILAENCERLWGKVHHNAPSAQRGGGSTQIECRVGSGLMNIKLSRVNIVPPGEFKESKWDVVAMSEASVTQSGSSYTWSASLWYMKRSPNDDYRWHEVSYWQILGGRLGSQPFACRDLRDADFAAANMMHTVGRAFGPELIDDEKEDSFHDRWMWLLARATTGHLRAPSSLPIRGWPPQM